MSRRTLTPTSAAFSCFALRTTQFTSLTSLTSLTYPTLWRFVVQAMAGERRAAAAAEAAAAASGPAVGAKRKASDVLASEAAKKAGLFVETSHEEQYATFALYWTKQTDGVKPRPVLGVRGSYPEFVPLVCHGAPVQKILVASDLECHADGTPKPFARTKAPISWYSNDAKDFVSLSVRYTKDGPLALGVPTRSGGVLYARFHAIETTPRARPAFTSEFVEPDELVPVDQRPPLHVASPIQWLPPMTVAVGDASLSELTPTTPTVSVLEAVRALNEAADAAFEAFLAR